MLNYMFVSLLTIIRAIEKELIWFLTTNEALYKNTLYFIHTQQNRIFSSQLYSMS